jgi:alpha-beta hydrolase superfamily lysophospholipase
MVSTPLFYSNLTAFKELLPLQPSSKIAPKTQRLLNSYLDHYDIDFVKQSLASNYVIWKTTIADYTIVQHCWESRDSQKTLIINHGYFDHSGLYGQLIAWGLKHNYRVIAYDMPGHGLSSGAPAAIDSFNTYSHVLKEVILQALDVPTTNNTSHRSTIDLIGQSTGCAVIANYLLKQPPGPCINRVALLAPLVRSMGWQGMRWAYFLCRPFLSTIRRRFINSSHNTHFNYFLQHEDPLQARKIPLSWLGAMEDWYQYLNILLETDACQRPIVIIQGTGDMTVDWRYNIPELRRCFPNSTVHLIPKARHHLVKETTKFWKPVTHLLDKTIDSPHWP